MRRLTSNLPEADGVHTLRTWSSPKSSRFLRLNLLLIIRIEKYMVFPVKGVFSPILLEYNIKKYKII